MIKKLLKIILCLSCAGVLVTSALTGCGAGHGPGQDTGAAPMAEGAPDGIDHAGDPGVSGYDKPVIRVACFYEEEYDYWTDELKYMASNLLEMGRISKYQARNYPTMTEAWEALSGATGMTTRGRISFLPGRIYMYSEMSDEELNEMLAMTDVDLLLTFGSVCGKFMTANADKISYDYMVFGAANPVAGGIIKSETERFNDHSFAMTDSGETSRALQVAYEIFHFSDIGVVYENSDAAYVYSGIDALEEMAETYGFRIHREYVDEAAGDADLDRHYRELKEAYARLLPEIDTLLVTTGTLEDYERVPELMEPVINAGIVTIAQDAEEQCRLGMMMHLMVTTAEDDGDFMASTIAEYCDGTPITELRQEYVAEPRLYLNYEVARRTGYRLPMSAYMNADVIYAAEDME